MPVTFPDSSRSSLQVEIEKEEHLNEGKTNASDSIVFVAWKPLKPNNINTFNPNSCTAQVSGDFALTIMTSTS